ncbi:hypothetical protein DENSPDRAFT_840681 [Dentipellis sp. KUC8613]|nr:hypothetical protein DENSPDRAFT_840681 [Dentipellis sp. KUC8613]
MKSIAVVSALATVALAQSSGSNPLIPSGISSGCSSFLTQLNSDTSLASCTQPLVQASSEFAPGSNTTNPSSSTIQSALNNICGTSAACPDSTIRGQLANFYSACQAELTSSANADVIRQYDVLYALQPLQQSVCAKDDSGRYCVISMSTSSSSSKRSLAQDAVLERRDGSSQYAFVPNVTTYRNKNILFLGLQPDSPSSLLCSSCSRSIMTAYMQFESSVPYAPGLPNSPLLGGQNDTYSAIQSQCGADFLSAGTQNAAPAAAGGLSGGVLNGAPRALDNTVVMASSILGAVAAAFVAL